MRSIDRELVRYFVSLLEGVVLPMADAAQMADLIEEREELLANLLLRRRSFDAFPEIVDTISQAAKQLGQDAQTRRIERADYGRIQKSYDDWERALRAVIDEAGAEIFDKASLSTARYRRHANEVPAPWGSGPFQRPTAVKSVR